MNGGDHGHSCIHGAASRPRACVQELHAGNALPVFGLTECDAESVELPA